MDGNQSNGNRGGKINKFMLMIFGLLYVFTAAVTTAAGESLAVGDSSVNGVDSYASFNKPSQFEIEYTGYTSSFKSYIDLGLGAGVERIDSSSFSILTPVFSVTRTGSNTSIYSTLVHNVHDIYIDFETVLNNPLDGDGLADWTTTARIRNKTGSDLTIKYYWYLDWELSINGLFDSAFLKFSDTVVTDDGGSSPYFTFFSYGADHWEIDNYSTLLNKLLAGGAFDLSDGNTPYGPDNLSAALQSTFIIASGESHTLSQTAGATVPFGGTLSTGRISAAEIVDFGDITVGSYVETPIVVTNSGEENILIGSISAPASPFSIETDSCSGAELTPAASCAIDIRFNPQEFIKTSGEIHIPSNDIINSDFIVSLTGKGAYQRVSGSGLHIPGPGAKAVLYLDVDPSGLNLNWLDYQNTEVPLLLSSTGITEFSVSGDTAVISGDADVNGSSGYTFTATIVDLNGATDEMGIRIFDQGSSLIFEYPQGAGASSGIVDGLFSFNRKAPMPVLVDQVSSTRLYDTLDYLVSYPGRNTNGTMDRILADFREDLHNAGASVWLHSYGTNSLKHNLAATVPAGASLDPLDPHLVVGGHVDTYNSYPGADDNASGVSAILEAARILASVDLPLRVDFVFFTYEEQGLLGSSAYAADAAAISENITGMIAVDMIGYPNPADEKLYLMTRPGTGNEWMVNSYENAVSAYSDLPSYTIINDYCG